MSVGPGEGVVSAGILGEAALTTAVAIADRAARTEALVDSISAQIQGIPYVEKPLEVRRAAHLGRSTLMLLHVEDPSRILTIQAQYEAGRGSDAAVQHRVEQAQEQLGISVSADTVRRVELSLLEAAQAGSGFDDQRASDNFGQLLQASKRVAERHDVDVAAVYTDDALYYEAASEAYTPEGDGQEAVDLLAAASEDTFTRFALNQIENFVPKEALAAMTEDDKTAMVMEMQLDPRLTAMVEQFASVGQEVTRQLLLYGFIRTHGYQALERLTPEQRDALTPRMPLARELSGLIPSE